MNEPDQHASPIKTPKQLVIVVVLAFVVPIAVIVLVTQLVTGVSHNPGGESAVLARIAPVGTIEIAAPMAPKGALTGEEVYSQTCKTCHEAGIAGALKLGDKAAWAKVIKQGEKLTVAHALAGIRAMPPRGGNAALTDAEVQRGVAFMAGRVGANWKEVPATAAPASAVAATSTATAMVASASAATVAAPVSAAAAPGVADGKKVYDGMCVACHAAGIVGAPKFGDKAAWAPRIAQGMPTLFTHAINGYTGKSGVMPPKGGAASLSDAEVKAGVEYMVGAVK
ncbi:MAG: c-type cytochrome [Betaproteobacteria bacterium]